MGIEEWEQRNGKKKNENRMMEERRMKNGIRTVMGIEQSDGNGANETGMKQQEKEERRIGNRRIVFHDSSNPDFENLF